MRGLLAFSLTLVGVAHAQAQAPPPPPLATEIADLDGDGKSDRIVLERDGTVRVSTFENKPLGELKLVAPAARIESSKIAIANLGKKQVAHVRARLRGAGFAEAVLALGGGKLEVLFNDRTGPIGDGDRSLYIAFKDGALWRWQTSPTVSRCDGEDRLFPERWDGRAFVPIDLPAPSGKLLVARTSAPQGLPGEALALFQFVAGSSDAASENERRADMLGAPRELQDHNTATVWQASGPNRGRGAWVTARAPDRVRRVTALRIVPGPGPSPRALTLLIDDTVYSIAPPQGMFFVVLPAPQPAACVSLVIAEPPSEGSGSPGTSLAEVTIFTDSDAVGGAAALAAQVAGDGPGAEGAARALTGLGRPALPAITGALETAHGNGRTRLIGVLASLDLPDAAPALGRALATAQEDAHGPSRERALLIDALGRLGAAGAKVSAGIFQSASQAPDARSDAAAALGKIIATGKGGESDAVAALLHGLRGAPSRLRLSAVTALQLSGPQSPIAIAAMRNALEEALHPHAAAPQAGAAPAAGSPPQPPTESAQSGAESAGAATSFEDLYLGDLARALGSAARRDPARDQIAGLLGEALGAARSFETRLRVVRAIGALGAPRSAALLVERVAKDKDEVVRWAATESARALDEQAGRPVLLAALADRDPRVRRSAVGGLPPGAHADNPKLLLESLRGDRWPLVRRAAVEGLAGACESAGVTDAMAAAVDDRAEDVRRASLVALARCLPQSPVIARALEDPKQALAVRELAAALMAKGRAPDAAKRIAAVLEQVLTDPNADERQAGLATACARALGRLGDSSPPVLEALNASAQHPMFATVRAASIETIGALCPGGAQAAFTRAADDPDPHVRQSATRAAARCKK
jgi:HEAT repeat protein